MGVRTVYRFFDGARGLQAIREKRLRISRFDELNDPFELVALDLSDKEVRKAFKAVQDHFSKNRGLICFSSGWHNPVMWSHYADKHKGICLGFQVKEKLLAPIEYSTRRLRAELETLLGAEENQRESAMLKCLLTKFSHWSYESEYRLFTDLVTPDDAGHYFHEFDEDLKLVSIAVGPRSDISRHVIEEAIETAEYSTKPLNFKARLAFKSFRIVRNENESLWT